jgi:predicted metal-binding membrane protein
MTLLALVIFIEKVFSWGPLFAKVIAAVLIVFGLLLSTQVLSF